MAGPRSAQSGIGGADFMDPRISVITLGVTDMARARAFYERLGWRASSQSQPGVTFFQVGGLVLSLYGREALAEDAQVPLGSGFGGVTLAYNVRSKAEVAATLAEAERAGGRILKPAQDVFWGGHSGYFADPEGHAWEVAWNPFWTFKSDGSIQLPP
jgi:catechol 2,3-dioxygenase-like lactoylglutathione lyase family enzyme